MTIYLVPSTYRSVAIDGSGAIDSQKFELPFPKPISLIIPVAGGDLLYLNYGQGAKLRPAPFKVVMMVSGASAAAMQASFDSFFGLPPTGFYGETGTFVAKVHGSATTKSCTAELFDVEVSQDTNWYKSTSKHIFNVSVTFKPVTLFA